MKIGETEARVSRGRRRILVVEDEWINREILNLMLERDYDVVFAETGAQALDILGEQFRTLSLVLLDLNLSLESIHQADGSGLSRNNYMTARWFTDYLLAMRRSPAFDAFLASLPAPGQGTLSVVKLTQGSRVRMKSGSMDGVLCYSGYILDRGGKPQYTFSLLTNNALAPAKDVRPVLMGFLDFLLSL